MIAIGLPDLTMVPVSFVPDDEVVRGLDQETPADLAPRILIGGPLAIPITPDTVAIDDDLRAFVAAEAAEAAYHLVHLAATFTGGPDDPPLVSATLDLLLSTDSQQLDDDAPPIAWSMLPLRLADDHESTTSWTLGPQLTLFGSGGSIGSFERTDTRHTAEVFIEALGLLRPDPGWRINATSKTAMTGTLRFVLVVRGPRDRAVHATISLRSTVRSRALLRYRSQALPPVEFSAAL